MFYSGKIKSFIQDGNRIYRIKRLMKKPWMEMKKKELISNVMNSEYEYGLTLTQGTDKIIVSMTSYPARFSVVTITLKSLLLQTKKPDKIILWYDCPENEISEEMLLLRKYGVEFRHIETNLKPHNKYYYAMQEFEDSIIITVDDDIVYPPSMIDELYNTYKKYPSCVCARRVHRIRYDMNGKALPYNNWMHECVDLLIPSHQLLATGASGVLYPPNCLDKHVFDKEAIKKYSLNADDIWLYAMERLNDTKVVYCQNDMPMPPSINSSQDSNLFMDNVVHGGNDKVIYNIMSRYDEKIFYNVRSMS